MSIEHPTFPNPTIREALCEIHFVLPESVPWRASLLSEFAAHIHSEFPTWEPVVDSGIHLQLKAGRVEIGPQPSRMRYKHASRPLLIQLSENVMTVNVLPTYEGWQKMEADVLQAWHWAEEVMQPAGIVRIGLRYINFIPKSQPNERLEAWLAPNDFVAKAILTSQPGFLSRIEVHTDLHRRTIITLGEAENGPNGEFILDVDCIAESANEPFIPLPTLNSLHDTTWEIFSAFLTPRYRALLAGGN